MTHDYDLSQDDFYKSLENATASVTNEVAYRLTGHFAFQNIYATFGVTDELRVTDVGCYTGGSTIRWLHTSRTLQPKTPLQILGFDVYEATIAQANENYGGRAGLSFVHKPLAQALPLINDAPYHLMFATFVLETITDYEQVRTLCSQLVAGLLPQGEIYFLRLHPNALTYQGTFRDYRLRERRPLTHGETFRVRLAGHNKEFLDHYWQPEELSRFFTAQGCTVHLIPMSWDAPNAMTALLKQITAATRVEDTLPEWTVPLYQIIRVVKNA
ncbi:class I SAM-dependent methyltransferase [bacterium]|nr:class I SAM-dependent methyltransferase [bacterium]